MSLESAKMPRLIDKELAKAEALRNELEVKDTKKTLQVKKLTAKKK